MKKYAIVVFSHLRWDFVFQRPQHLLSRMAARFGHPVIFIEEPLVSPDQNYLEVKQAASGVLVCRPYTEIATPPGFAQEQLPFIAPLIENFLREHDFRDYCIWFYTPMAFPLMSRLSPLAVIYDCMDELSTFDGAPPDLVVREAELLATADVVFTGGKSLYEAKCRKHHNARCFPSSVDGAHFRRAITGLPEPDDQTVIAHPKLGYFGVIDERLDYVLLRHLAEARPDWQVIMLGPVVKIDPQTLPRAANVHYLAQKSYDKLPSYVTSWDLALLPFAINDATKYISPTKTLEYMAAEKMIVSTPIADVVHPYSEIVYIGEGPEEFERQCESALAGDGRERERRLTRMRSVLANTSWDLTVKSMHAFMDDAVHGRGSSTRRRERSNAPVAIVGAGPTGLSAAYHLGSDAILIEKDDRVGGWCRSLVDRGFTFDWAGHIMFSKEPYVHEMYKMLLGDNIHWQDREAWIYSKGVDTRYPFQGALYGLPPAVIKECIVGAIEARYGPLKETREASDANGKMELRTNGKAHSQAVCQHESIADCCADGILEASAELNVTPRRELRSIEPRNFEEFIYKVWGTGIAKHFAIPYNKKLWAVPLNEMETSWLGGRVPMSDLEEMIEGALQPVPKPMGPNARFGYPLRGGFQALMNGFLPHLKGELRLNTRVARVRPLDKKLEFSDGKELRYESLISTMPLPLLIGMMGDDPPEEVRAAARQLRAVSVRCVHIGVGREKLTEKHWIYCPEATVFHRIFVQGNASPYCNAPGGFGLTCEITYSPQKPLPCDGEELIRRCVDDCRKMGMIGADDTIWASNQVDLPYAYVVYDHARPHLIAIIREWLSQYDIHLAGRYSEWEYYNSDHAFLAGKNAAEDVRKNLKPSGLTRTWTITRASGSLSVHK